MGTVALPMRDQNADVHRTLWASKGVSQPIQSLIPVISSHSIPLRVNDKVEEEMTYKCPTKESNSRH